MSTLKLLSLVFAAAAVMGLVLGSFGVSGVSADRDVVVNVVEDDRAFIGFAAQQINPNKVTVKITNRHIRDFEVTVEAETAVTKTIAVGKAKSFSVRVACTTDAPSDQLVTVTAQLRDQTVEFATIERVIEVPPCTHGDDDDVDSETES